MNEIYDSSACAQMYLTLTYQHGDHLALRPQDARQDHQWTTHFLHDVPDCLVYPRPLSLVIPSSVTEQRDRVGSTQSEDLRTARQMGVPPNGVEVLLEQAVVAAMCAHDGLAVDLRWAHKKNLETEGCEIDSWEVLLGACDPP